MRAARVSPVVVVVAAAFALLMCVTSLVCVVSARATNSIDDWDDAVESPSSADGLTWMKGGMGWHMSLPPLFSVHSTYELPWLDWLPGGHAIIIDTPIAFVYNYLMKQRTLDMWNNAALDEELLNTLRVSGRTDDEEQEATAAVNSTERESSGLTWMQGGMGLKVPFFSACAKYSLPWLDWLPLPLPGYGVFFGQPNAMSYSYMTNEDARALLNRINAAMCDDDSSTTLSKLHRIAKQIVHRMKYDTHNDDDDLSMSGAAAAAAAASSSSSSSAYPFCPPWWWCRWHPWYPPCRFCFPPPPPPPPYCYYCWYYPWLPFCRWCF